MKAKQNSWRFYLMHYESMNKEQIFVMTSRCKAKLERNINVCKSTKYNISLIRHNGLTMRPRGLSPTRKQVVKTIGKTFYDSKQFQRDRQFKQKYLAGNIYVRYLS